MTQINRVSGRSDELEFLKRVAMSIEMMELAIHLYLGGLSLSNTIRFLIGLE